MSGTIAISVSYLTFSFDGLDENARRAEMNDLLDSLVWDPLTQ
jgi:hypothetical protein